MAEVEVLSDTTPAATTSEASAVSGPVALPSRPSSSINAAAGTTVDQETLSASTPRSPPAVNNDHNNTDAIATAIEQLSQPSPPDIAVHSPTTSERNQAPGIPDRRKSLRPNSKSPGGSRKGRGPKTGAAAWAGKRMSMADVAAEMKIKDDTEGETAMSEKDEDTFEDANDDTPRPEAKDDGEDQAAGEVNGNKDKSESKTEHGLGIDGTNEKLQGTPSVPKTGDATADATPASSPPSKSNLHSRDPSMSPSKSGRQSPTKHMRGLSGDFVVDSAPPPSTADRQHNLEQRHVGERPPPAAQAGAAKKGGFAGFLGRMGSIRKARSPDAPREGPRFRRRDTAASTNSTASALASIPDAGEATPRPGLREQFESLRRQEEFTLSGANGHASLSGADKDQMDVMRSQSDADVPSSPTRRSQDSDTRTERALSTPGVMKSPPLNPKLPPGTASGLTAGAPEEPKPVNWDLWQQVVYEGPSTVQRSSGEELREAIADGIPPAIRGVVWQVLAESKNEELEQIYKTLKSRGTDASKVEQGLRPAPMSRHESQTVMTNGASDAKSVSSSRSSTHSDGSSPTPATSAMTSPPPSVQEQSTEVTAKLLAEKQKRESAALQKLEKTIRRDLGARTSFSKYAQSAGLQDGLFGVCKAYALFDEGVGYAQGINFIAMPLLFNMSEEEAFTLLVKLMSKYDLRSMFTPVMEGLHLRLYQFERLLEDLEPALYCHLKRRHVAPQLYATQWFLTLFAYRFPLQLVLRIHDLILSEGLTAILRFGIVLMQRNREALLSMKDMSSLSNFLKEKLFDVYIDKSPDAKSVLETGFFGSVSGGADKELYRADEMVRDACSVKVSDELLSLYTAEWEEQTRSEASRTEELDSLRAASTTLTSRVRDLESRTQEQDTEHVFIASELVNLKLQNDRLLDENEGFKMKVEELSKIADAQPAEVEAKLKDEMERIMQRNIEVQNENRSLKEECEELEAAVVEAKMVAAQVRTSKS